MMSRESAYFFSSLGNIALILSLSVGVISTILVVWMANIKEEYLKRDLAEADERIALANLAGEQAKQEAAEANERAVQATLELEKFRAPRSISLKKAEAIIERIRGFAPQLYTGVLAPSGFDIPDLWTQINSVLTSAGWQLGKPAGLSVGNPPAGVAIQANLGITVTVKREGLKVVGPAATALTEALKDAGLQASMGLIGDHKETREHVITIVVGPKPQ